jgi:lipopolysaccharide biosynthesis glycosyltransferase
MIKWFIGYDKDEAITAYVLAHSIQTRSSIPVSITFLNRESLKGIFTRERGEYDSTDFSISRFLVPYLCNFEGHAIFSDCDMVVRDDPAKLWAWRDDQHAVKVVKHNHVPVETVKFLGNIQTQYDRKNWSSLMLFHNSQCTALTPEYVNIVNGLDLHRFKFLAESEIGDLPKQWNLLVDYDKSDVKACLVHYTKGGPWFKEYANCDYHQDWHREKTLMNHTLENIDDKMKIVK